MRVVKAEKEHRIRKAHEVFHSPRAIVLGRNESGIFKRGFRSVAAMSTPRLFPVTALAPSASLVEALRVHWREYLMEVISLL